MADKLLGTIGLCKRAGMLAAGEEPAEAVCRAKDARLLLLASDAADNTARRVRHFAEEGACLWLRVPFTKSQLGRAVGRTSCAIAAVTDIGFATAIARRLADDDPAAYGDAAEKLHIKAQRAAERKEELRVHEKNVRAGKRKSGGEAMEAAPPSDAGAKRTNRPRGAEPGTPPPERSKSGAGRAKGPPAHTPRGKSGAGQTDRAAPRTTGARGWAGKTAPRQTGGAGRPGSGAPRPKGSGYAGKAAPRPGDTGRPGGASFRFKAKAAPPGSGAGGPETDAPRTRRADAPGHGGAADSGGSGRQFRPFQSERRHSGNSAARFAHSHPVKKGKGSRRRPKDS